MTISKEMVKGSTASLVLSMLYREPMYGYEMIKEMEARSDGIFAFKEGTLYPILHSLEEHGLIQAFWQGEEGSRQRKYYQLTTHGQLALEAKRREWAVFRTAVDKFLLEVSYTWA